MKTMDEEYNRTTKKMADAVMEYAAQFVARSYLDEYQRAEANLSNVFIPESFDKEIYKKISKLPRRQQGWGKRMIRNAVAAILTAFLIFCVGVTGVVFFSESLRSGLILTVLGG